MYIKKMKIEWMPKQNKQQGETLLGFISIPQCPERDVKLILTVDLTFTLIMFLDTVDKNVILQTKVECLPNNQAENECFRKLCYFSREQMLAFFGTLLCAFL